MIELRSDTLSLPTPEMIAAMAAAKVGDDTVDRDPTVEELEQMSAALFGKEAALFAVSGTMANQLAVVAFCERGDEVIVGEASHIYNLEVSALAALSQVQARPVQVQNGQYPLEAIESLLARKGIQAPKTSLLCLENSENLNEGNLLCDDNVKAVSDLAHRYGANVFTDGARILNAAAKKKNTAAKLVQDSDAVMLTLTKGLCAPFGAVLAGKKEFIEKARWYKQRIGGGFRQAGYMAAPAIVALKTMQERLADDNRRAGLLAQAVAASPHLTLLNRVDTNIVRIGIKDTRKVSDFETKLAREGLRLKKIAPGEFRAVLHAGIDDTLLARASEILGNE